MARTRGIGPRKRKAMESHETNADRGTIHQESTSGVANRAISEPCESSTSQSKKLKIEFPAQKESSCPLTSSQSSDEDVTPDTDSSSVDSSLQQRQHVNNLEDDIKKRDMELINSASVEDLRNIVKRLYKIQPGLILGMFRSLDSAPPTQPSGKKPGFCVCGHCVESKGRYAHRENVCCGRKPCLSIDPMMDDVLDEENLEMAKECHRNYRNRYQMSMEETQKAYRHMAYKEFEDWHFGGRNSCRVIPSCVVARIRDTFPSPFNDYRGYDPRYY